MTQVMPVSAEDDPQGVTLLAALTHDPGTVVNTGRSARLAQASPPP
jgi:hypothetical protein